MHAANVAKSRLVYLLVCLGILAALVFILQHGRSFYLYLTNRPAYWVYRLSRYDPMPPVEEEQEAVEAWVRIGSPALPTLLKSLTSSGYRAHNSIQQAISRIAPGGVNVLIELLSHPDDSVRFAALHTLADIGPNAAPAIPAIRRLQQDRAVSVRQKAIEVIMKVSTDPDVLLAALNEAIRDQSLQLTEAVAEPLLKLELDPQLSLPVLLKALRNESLRDESVRSSHAKSVTIVKVLSKLGSPAVPTILELLKEPDARTRGLAAQCLKEMGTSAVPAVPGLIEALQDSNREVRMWATYALRRIGPEAEPAVPALIAMLSDPDSSIRQCAVMALGGIGPRAKPAVKRLIELVRNDEDEWLPNDAVYALGHIGPLAAEAVPALIEHLGHGRMNFRCAAAWALGEIGSASASAVPGLLQRLEDSEWYVRTSAIMALGKIRQDSEQVVPAITGAVKDPSPYVRTAAVMALGDFGERARSAVPVLTEAVRDPANITPNNTPSGSGRRERWSFSFIDVLDQYTVREKALQALEKIDPLTAEQMLPTKKTKIVESPSQLQYGDKKQ